MIHGRQVGVDITIEITYLRPLQQSLTYGRPPSLSHAHIDNQLPNESGKDEEGEMTCIS
jgi:hypothetical protein